MGKRFQNGPGKGSVLPHQEDLLPAAVGTVRGPKSSGCSRRALSFGSPVTAGSGPACFGGGRDVLALAAALSLLLLTLARVGVNGCFGRCQPEQDRCPILASTRRWGPGSSSSLPLRLPA